METIRNQELKKRILALHTNQFGTLNHRIENQYSNIKEYGRPIIRKRFRVMRDLKYEPLNQSEIMEDVEVWNILNTLRGNYFRLQGFLTEIKDEMELIEQMIKVELE